MIIEFIKLRIRETTRSSVWSKNLTINILLVLMMMYLAVCFLIAGLFLDRIVIKSFPDSDPVELFNRMLIYYFGLELLVRFFMQSTPAMSIYPFLHLPVRRSCLMHFLLARSIINPINYISFLIFIPFACRVVSVLYTGTAACWWLFALFLLTLFVIYTHVYIKRQLVVKPVVTLCCGLVFITLIVLDIFDVFSLSMLSAMLFGVVLEEPLWIMMLVTLVVGIYLLNYRFLMTHSYSEEIDRTTTKKQVSAQSFGFISRFGQIGELIGLELKLILRHKRTKSIIYWIPMYWLLGLLFYRNPHKDSNIIMLMFLGFYMTGVILYSYGNYIVAWEGKFFDGILTRNSSILDYFRAKYYMLALSGLICYLLSLPFAFFGVRVLLINTVCFLYNIGVIALIELYIAQQNRKPIALSKGSAFSLYTPCASHFIVLVPAMLLPMYSVPIFSWIGLENWGLGVFAALGIIGIFYHKRIILALCRRFEQTKYALAEGFRKN